MRRLVVNLSDARPIWSVPAWAIEEIRAALPAGVEMVVVGSRADGRGDGGAYSTEAAAAVAGAEIHLGFGFPRALFEAARRGGDSLRWVHSGTAGVGGSLYREMAASPVLLTNSAGIHAEPIADHVLAAVHYFARGFDLAVQARHDRVWRPEPFEAADSRVREVAGATLGVVGYGGIGRAVAARALSLGMRVLAHRRRPAEAGPGVEPMDGAAGLDRLLREAEYVVLALPRTAETQGLLGETRIASLRRDAVCINVGRGELVDEDALARALAEGRIRGAALDVFREEPLPSTSPLWSLPNVLITPHVSATSHRFWRREVDLIVENLGRYERREPLRNLVDKGAGY
jgi:phosphoglycerate dehydrogenase-like enzyme